MMFWDDSSWAWWQAGLMWLAVIAFWALLILTVYALVTGITRKPDRAGREGSRVTPEGDARVSETLR